MAASGSSRLTPVIAADASEPFTPRLLVAELLRTRYCTPGSIFLVEGIEAQVAVSKRYRTVRLLLGDGELCIQALLRPEMHRFVDSGQIFVGCYAQLSRFEIKSISIRVSDGSDDTEEMVFLVVRDMVLRGWNTAYMQMAGTLGQEPQRVPTDLKPVVSKGKSKTVVWEDQQQPEIVLVRRGGSPAPNGNMKDSTEDKMRDVEDMSAGEGNELDDTSFTLQQRSAASHPSYSATGSLPWVSDDLTRPLKLTPLKSIPNLPYKQNWVVNVLAVVASLSDVESASLPPYKQRTGRLVDPSTSKQVHLTVFLSPDDFTPKVGSVVLLLGVKNHRFDGGSLKKYGNEKVSDDSKWWFENPSDIEWCDVAGLRKWWDERPA